MSGDNHERAPSAGPTNAVEPELLTPPPAWLPVPDQPSKWGLYVSGKKFDFGWDLVSRKHGPHLFVRRHSAMGDPKVQARYPVSEVGWAGAWELLAREEPATALKLRDRLNADALKELELDAATLELEARGKAIGPIYKSLTVVGGYGWSPVAGTRVTVAVGIDHLLIAPVPLQGPTTTVCYQDLLTFEFLGGARTTGGGFFGGGFGVAGVLEGMVVASILNALTTKTTVNSVVRISGRDGETLLHVPDRMPADLRNWFAPAVNAVEAQKRTAPPAPPAQQDDIVAQLERLAALRGAGHLTEEEFASAKAALLRGSDSASEPQAPTG